MWKNIFSETSSRKTSKKIHTEEKYSCDVCAKFFSTKYNLNAHRKLHTDGKTLVYSCECGKAFRDQKSLKVLKIVVDNENTLDNIS
jgi:hypothetical protein